MFDDLPTEPLHGDAAIHSAVVLAAGLGSRLHGEEVPKPLREVAGRPLLGWVLEGLRRAGVVQVAVVTGFRGEEVARAARQLAPGGLELRIVPNPRWKLANGVSALAARGTIRAPFLLLMSDHLLAPAVLQAAVRLVPPERGAVLMVDADIDAVFDLDDATKVRLDGPRIVEVGKQLPQYDALDTGVFACSTALWDALEATLARRGDASLSDGVNELAHMGQMLAAPLPPGAWWLDVDTPEAHAEAERRMASVHHTNASAAPAVVPTDSGNSPKE